MKKLTHYASTIRFHPPHHPRPSQSVLSSQCPSALLRSHRSGCNLLLILLLYLTTNICTYARAQYAQTANETVCSSYRTVDLQHHSDPAFQVSLPTLSTSNPFFALDSQSKYGYTFLDVNSTSTLPVLRRVDLATQTMTPATLFSVEFPSPVNYLVVDLNDEYLYVSLRTARLGTAQIQRVRIAESYQQATANASINSIDSSFTSLSGLSNPVAFAFTSTFLYIIDRNCPSYCVRRAAAATTTSSATLTLDATYFIPLSFSPQSIAVDPLNSFAYLTAFGTLASDIRRANLTAKAVDNSFAVLNVSANTNLQFDSTSGQYLYFLSPSAKAVQRVDVNSASVDSSFKLDVFGQNTASGYSTLSDVTLASMSLSNTTSTTSRWVYFLELQSLHLLRSSLSSTSANITRVVGQNCSVVLNTCANVVAQPIPPYTLTQTGSCDPCTASGFQCWNVQGRSAITYDRTWTASFGTSSSLGSVSYFKVDSRNIFMYFLDYSKGTFKRVRLDCQKMDTSFPGLVFEDPLAFAISSDDSFALVIDVDSKNAVSYVYKVLLNIDGTLIVREPDWNVTITSPQGIVIDSQSKFAYISDDVTLKVYRLDLTTRELVSNWRNTSEPGLRTWGGPGVLALAPFDTALYVVDNGARAGIVKISLPTGKTDAVFTSAQSNRLPSSLAITRDNAYLYTVFPNLGATQQKLGVIDLSTATSSDLTLPSSAIPFSSIKYLAIDPISAYLYFVDSYTTNFYRLSLGNGVWNYTCTNIPLVASTRSSSSTGHVSASFNSTATLNNSSSSTGDNGQFNSSSSSSTGSFNSTIDSSSADSSSGIISTAESSTATISSTDASVVVFSSSSSTGDFINTSSSTAASTGVWHSSSSSTGSTSPASGNLCAASDCGSCALKPTNLSCGWCSTLNQCVQGTAIASASVCPFGWGYQSNACTGSSAVAVSPSSGCTYLGYSFGTLTQFSFVMLWVILGLMLLLGLVATCVKSLQPLPLHGHSAPVESCCGTLLSRNGHYLHVFIQFLHLACLAVALGFDEWSIDFDYLNLGLDNLFVGVLQYRFDGFRSDVSVPWCNGLSEHELVQCVAMRGGGVLVLSFCLLAGLLSIYIIILSYQALQENDPFTPFIWRVSVLSAIATCGAMILWAIPAHLTYSQVLSCNLRPYISWFLCLGASVLSLYLMFYYRRSVEDSPATSALKPPPKPVRPASTIFDRTHAGRKYLEATKHIDAAGMPTDPDNPNPRVNRAELRKKHVINAMGSDLLSAMEEHKQTEDPFAAHDPNYVGAEDQLIPESTPSKQQPVAIEMRSPAAVAAASPALARPPPVSIPAATPHPAIIPFQPTTPYSHVNAYASAATLPAPKSWNYSPQQPQSLPPSSASYNRLPIDVSQSPLLDHRETSSLLGSSGMISSATPSSASAGPTGTGSAMHSPAAFEMYSSNWKEMQEERAKVHANFQRHLAAMNALQASTPFAPLPPYQPPTAASQKTPSQPPSASSDGSASQLLLPRQLSSSFGHDSFGASNLVLASPSSRGPASTAFVPPSGNAFAVPMSPVPLSHSGSYLRAGRLPPLSTNATGSQRILQPKQSGLRSPPYDQ